MKLIVIALILVIIIYSVFKYSESASLVLTISVTPWWIDLLHKKKEDIDIGTMYSDFSLGCTSALLFQILPIFNKGTNFIPENDRIGFILRSVGIFVFSYCLYRHNLSLIKRNSRDSKKDVLHWFCSLGSLGFLITGCFMFHKILNTINDIK